MDTLANRPGVVYGIRLADSTKYRYVGIAANLHLRKVGHKHALKKGQLQPVYCWIRKHGWDSIAFDVMEEHTNRADLNAAEVRIIAALRASGADLMNRTDGGDGGAGHKHSAESLAKMRILQSGENNAMWGKKRDPEHMARMTRLAAAKPITEERRAQMVEFGKTRVHSAERNQKIRDAKLIWWANWRAERAAEAAAA